MATRGTQKHPPILVDIFLGKPEKNQPSHGFYLNKKKAFSTQLILMLMNVGCEVQISSTFRNPEYREYEMVLVATSSFSWTWPSMAHLSPLFSSAVLAAPHVPLPEAARPVGSRNRPGTLGTAQSAVHIGRWAGAQGAHPVTTELKSFIFMVFPHHFDLPSGYD